MEQATRKTQERQKIVVSIDTHDVLESRKRGGETFDKLIRRMNVSNMESPIDELSEEQRNFVNYKA